MQEKQCFNANASYNQAITRAQAFIRRSQYREAGEQLKIATGISTNKPADCSINDTKVLQLQTDISRPCEYLARLDSIGTLLASGNYAPAKDIYSRAGALHRLYGLDKKGINHLTYIQFVNSSKQNEFIIFECLRLSKTGYPDDAFGLLQTLAARRLPAEDAAEAQREVANSLAARDKRKGEFTNPLTLLAKYRVEDLWYEVFRKTYVKTFRKS